MADGSFLQALQVSKIYPGKQLAGVKSANFNIEPGKITAIIGESGSGKSTLLRLLYGLLSPDEGEVHFKGERIWGPTEKLIPGHDAMKMVTQHTDDLNLYAKVWDNIAYLLPNTDLKAKQEKSAKVLEQLNMLHMADRKVAELSGGEKQRVAIARALVTQPEVLLLDEPFNQVDTAFREGLQRDIRQIVQETGLTVVMVSHDPAEVLAMADELIVFKSGEVLESGRPKTIYEQPQHLYTARLLTNGNILTKEQAALLHIKSDKNKIVIYPEWITLTSSWTHKDWTVKQVLFRGFFEDLVLENNGVIIHGMCYEPGKYAEGTTLHIKVSRYLEYMS